MIQKGVSDFAHQSQQAHTSSEKKWIMCIQYREHNLLPPINKYCLRTFMCFAGEQRFNAI